MTTKQQILKLLREDLKVAKERETKSDIEQCTNRNEVTKSHYFTDMGLVNGILNSIDTVLGVNEETE